MKYIVLDIVQKEGLEELRSQWIAEGNEFKLSDYYPVAIKNDQWILPLCG